MTRRETFLWDVSPRWQLQLKAKRRTAWHWLVRRDERFAEHTAMRIERGIPTKGMRGRKGLLHLTLRKPDQFPLLWHQVGAFPQFEIPGRAVPVSGRREEDPVVGGEIRGF
jgi:hypothetical protein